MENLDWKNIDELLEIHQIHQYFPRKNFVPYGTHHHSPESWIMNYCNTYVLPTYAKSGYIATIAGVHL